MGSERVSIKKSDLRLPVSSLKLVCFPALAATDRGYNYFPRLAGGTIPFIRRYSIICP